LAAHDKPVVVWCHSNAEGDLIEELVPDSTQIAGKTPDDEREAIYCDFAAGRIRALVIKPKIGAWGLNWQHCAHVITFASHSYEQYYQSVRRCWRFGQTMPVTVDVIATEGELRVVENMQRKAAQADTMFEMLVKEMNYANTIRKTNEYTKKAEVPSWL
jgi:SNF2 family DNA or RNA helicase